MAWSPCHSSSRRSSWEAAPSQHICSRALIPCGSTPARLIEQVAAWEYSSRRAGPIRFEQGRTGVETITVPVDGLNVATCAQSIEKRVGAFSGVREVAASYVTQTVSITFDERLLGEATVRDLVRDCGFACGRTCDPVEMLALAAASNAAPPAHEHTHDHAMEQRTDTSTGV